MKFDAVPSIDEALDSVLEAFRNGDFVRAEAQAESALSIDFEHTGIQSALKSSLYWKDRLARSESLSGPEERGDFLLREWNGFLTRFRSYLDDPYESGLTAIQDWVFEAAATAFLEQVPFEEEPRQHDLVLKAARTWKALGAFDRAMESLDKVLQLRPEDAGALFEMADCLNALGETTKSRLLFREAFYWDAQAVNLDFVSTTVIQELAERLKSLDYSPSEVKEWIPVHAVVQGIFSSRRTLKSLEVGHLKQSINALKSEMHDREPAKLVLPRLLYRYFWLIDYYTSINENPKKIEDVLLNIKLLDSKIYELYTR